MKTSIKILLLVGVLMYVFSPMDLYPGPIDDAIIIALGMAAKRGLKHENAR
ncbi:MAG: DUF1232 domain-containing protein [Firmicutes bacterium]|jgi:uncharacterized membrane protein YkvA (DUF1232 family)|nr:DUF1232 domain-containing protein [Bacillota bacterium]